MNGWTDGLKECGVDMGMGLKWEMGWKSLCVHIRNSNVCLLARMALVMAAKQAYHTKNKSCPDYLTMPLGLCPPCCAWCVLSLGF